MGLTRAKDEECRGNGFRKECRILLKISSARTSVRSVTLISGGNAIGLGTEVEV